MDPGEDCDDGNQVTEWSCGPYGGQVPQPSCFVCDLNCREREGSTWCGNGSIDPFNGETCDDGNNDDGDGCSGDGSTLECRNDVVSCELDPAWGTPGSTVAAHATIRNDGPVDCDAQVLWYEKGMAGVPFSILNLPDGQVHTIPSGGGTWEFDIEVQLGSGAVDAREPRWVNYFVDASFSCDEYQWISAIPSGELSWFADAPPPSSGLAPYPYDGWNCNNPTQPEGCTAKLFGASLNGSANFTGRTIWEYQPHDASDTCHDHSPGSGIPLAHLTVPSIPWLVEGRRFYHYDGIGWNENVVDTYRTAGAGPCVAVIPQQMAMEVRVWPDDTEVIVFHERNIFWSIDRDCFGAPAVGLVGAARSFGVCDEKQ